MAERRREHDRQRICERRGDPAKEALGSGAGDLSFIGPIRGLDALLDEEAQGTLEQAEGKEKFRYALNA